MNQLAERFNDLERALDRVARIQPDRAARARLALQRALAPLSASEWPELALSFSWLTNTGYPVELAWASRDSYVRWTADVAAPESPERERRASVARWYRELIGSEPPQLLEQQTETLRYGAWLGMRHGDGADVGKIYLELAQGLCEREQRRHQLLRTPELHWRMAGFLPVGLREYYARTTSLDGGLLDRLEQAAFGEGSRLRRAAAALCACELPARSGVSVTLDRDARVLSLTWFCFAKHVFKDDLRTQRAVLRAASEQPCATGSLELYEALAAGRPDGRWRHAIIGIGLAADGGSWIQAGIRPT